MCITVFGASGSTGQIFLEAAARQGSRPVAQLRETSTLGPARADRLVIGDLFSERVVDQALAGSCAAVIAFRLRGDRTTPLYS